MAQAVNGTATLHKIPNEDILEGSWVQGGDEGRWLDEVYLKIDGRMVYLWRAVDAEGEVLDVAVAA